MHRALILPGLMLLSAVGCGADQSTSPDPTTTSNTSCAIALSGGRSGPLTCSNVVAIQTGNDGKTSFAMTGTDATDTLSVVVAFVGPPMVQTYVSGTTADPILALITANTVWTTGPGDGSASLTITSVKKLSSGAGLTKYEVHGTLTATMIAEVSNGSVPPVTVTATF